MKSKYIKGLIAITLTLSISIGYTATTVMALESNDKTMESSNEELESKETLKEKEDNANQELIKEEVEKEEIKEEDIKSTKEDSIKDKKEQIIKEQKDMVKEKLSIEEKYKDIEEKVTPKKENNNSKKNIVPMNMWGNNEKLISEVCDKTGINNIKDVTYEDIAQIKRLDLSHSNIENLDILSKFTGLVSLNLWGANYTEETLDNISKIKGLKELDISSSGSGIKDLPSSMANLTELEFIDISGNEFGEIPKVLFEMPKLQYLNAIYCGVNSLPSDIGNLKSLVSLELAQNNLSSLPNELYEIKSLRYLGFEENKFVEIPKGIFTMKKLEDAVFKYNNIISIPTEIKNIVGDKTKFTLDISSNQVAKIPELQGQNVIYDNNFVTSYSNGKDNSNKLILTEKVLEIGKGEEVNQDDIRKLVKGFRYAYYGREVFDIDSRHYFELVINNKVVKVDELKNLEEGIYEAKIKLGLSDLENKAGETSSTIKIKVGDSEINKSESSKPNIPDNATGVIPMEYWENCTPLMNYVMETLNVDDIKNVTFEDLQKIYFLELPSQRLEELPSIVKSFKSLTFVDLSDNLFTEIPKELYGFENLQMVYLSSNFITKIPKELTQLKNLYHINLSYNDIKDIDDEVENMRVLMNISLSGNKNIQKDLYKIFNIKTLGYIDIDSCNLSYISENIKDISVLTKVSCYDNQLVKKLDISGVEVDSCSNILEDEYVYKSLVLNDDKLEVIKGAKITQEKLRKMVKVYRNNFTDDFPYGPEDLLDSHNITFIINNKEYKVEDLNKIKSGKYKAKLKIEVADMSNKLAITEDEIDLNIIGKDMDGSINPNMPSSNGEENQNNSGEKPQTENKTNQKVGANKLPKTGGVSGIASILFGTTAIGAGATILKRRRKDK